MYYSKLSVESLRDIVEHSYDRYIVDEAKGELSNRYYDEKIKEHTL